MLHGICALFVSRRQQYRQGDYSCCVLRRKIIYTAIKMFRHIVFAACALLGFSQNSIIVSDCGVGSNFTIQSLTFSPAAPIIGSSGTLNSIYDVLVSVSGGSARYSCLLNGLPVFDETHDLCTQTACPIAAGLHNDKSTSDIPNVNGKIVCKIVWTDAAGDLLMCIQTAFKLSSPLKLRGMHRAFDRLVHPIGGFVYSKALMVLPSKDGRTIICLPTGLGCEFYGLY
jgi:hypothetical protein